MTYAVRAEDQADSGRHAGVFSLDVWRCRLVLGLAAVAAGGGSLYFIYAER